MNIGKKELRELSDDIKRLALGCGFQKCGIVPAESLTREGRRLKEWLRRGFHGEMHWMEREPRKRSDPGLLLEGARSVVAVAMNYYTPHRHETAPGTGKVSRYAWGDDYHDIVGETLRELLAGIEKLIPGVNGKACVDTSPIMDKAWAVRAGIGWLGKHTNVITTDLGSWVFLGELVLDAELAYDEREVDDHCGSCTACIDACPTGAITEPYLVDSNKCISYATIELRDRTLPPDIEANLEGWAYGCDICQDVCPWNRFSRATDEQRFQPRPGNVCPDLGTWVEMEPPEYVERFRKSAMKRTKLSGLQRNASALLAAGKDRNP